MLPMNFVMGKYYPIRPHGSLSTSSPTFSKSEYIAPAAQAMPVTHTARLLDLDAPP